MNEILEIKEIIECFVALDGTDVECNKDSVSTAVYHVIQEHHKRDYSQLVALYEHHAFKKYYNKLLRLANDVRLDLANITQRAQ